MKDISLNRIQEMAIETAAYGVHPSGEYIYSFYTEQLQAFARLVAEHEREEISNEWWSCYQSDLENGVKSLNEYEAKKFATTYPELAKFGSWLEARGNP